ncbi:MAG: translocation/assembly module TamB domain-containing protein [Salinivirgaceae bacterium]
MVKISCNKLNLKNIKKTAKIVAYFILVLAGITITLWTAIRTPTIQTLLAKKAAQKIATYFNTDISIDRITYGLKRNFIIKGLYIADQNHDTLLYIGRLECNLKKLNFNKKKLFLDQIVLKDVTSKIRQIKDSTYNYSFLIDRLDTGKKSAFDWELKFDELNFLNNTVLFETNGKSFQISDFDANVEDIVIDSTNQSFNLTTLSFWYNNEIHLQNIAFIFKKVKQELAIEDLRILSTNSTIKIDGFWVEKKDSITPAIYHINNVSSKLFLNDFSSFYHGFKGNNEYLSISGSLSGNLSKIKGKKVKVNMGKASFLESSFEIRNITQPSQLTYSFEVENLQTSSNDLIHILGTYFKQDSSLIPEPFKNLGYITYKGYLKGSLDRIHNQGYITSNLGAVYSNLSVIKDTIQQKTFIEGNVKAAPLHLTTIIPSESLGEISFNLDTKGYYSNKQGIHLDIDGMIQSFAFNNQTIDSVGIKGALTKETFTGRISSFDPKLRFDFDGVLNLDTIPSYNFSMNLYSANLYALGIIKSDSTANLSMNLNANFIGNKFENTTGNIILTELYYFKDTSYFATDSITIAINLTENGRKLTFNSEYITAELEGHYNSLTLVQGVESLLNSFIPSLGIKTASKDIYNNFSFTIVANYPHPITEMFLPNYRISPGTTVTGSFNAANAFLSISCFTNKFEFHKRELDDMNLKLYTRGANLYLNLNSKKFKYFENTSLKNFLTSIKIHNDSIDINFNWNNWLHNNYSGNLNSLLTFSKHENRQKPDLKLDIFPSNIIVLDTTWYISKGYLLKDSATYIFSNVRIDNKNSNLSIDGKLSPNPNDSILFIFQNISLTHLNALINQESLLFNGNLSGKTKITDITGELHINSDFTINKLTLNNQLIGDTRFTSIWDKNEKKLKVQVISEINNITRVFIDGSVSPIKKEIDCNVQLNEQSLKILEPFLQPTFINFNGHASGLVRVYGELTNPKWEGKVYANQASLTVTPTMVNYHFSDSIVFHNHEIQFNRITAFDKDENQMVMNGTISHQKFSTFSTNLRFSTNRILGLNTKVTDNPLFYGKVYGAGYVKIYGPSDNTKIDIVATTLRNSQFFIPLEGKGDIQENGFIEFVEPYKAKKKEKKESNNYLEQESEVSIIIDLTVTPDAEVQILFDPKIGDALKANGYAHLNMESVNGGFDMYGDYRINKGEFTFTLQNVINKKFEIQSGSSVNWSGDPIDATINLDAVYKIKKASVFDLTMDEADREKKVEVDCHLKMTDKLINPTISFAVQVPANTNEAAIDQINTLPEEEINKQVLSLLLVNKFMPLYQGSYATNTSGNLTATTVSELMSNQLSKWVSQINSDFDLGFVYRPGTETTEQEYEVALSTNLWNDRLSVNSNVGYSVQQNQTTPTPKNPYTTDFQIEYKVNKKGNIRLRAFQKVNSDIEYSQAPYTQGLGIFYTEDFDNFNQLMQKIFKNEYATKPDDLEIKREEKDSLP